VACDPFTDRQCRHVTVCSVGYPQLIAPTETSDRICATQPISTSDLPSVDQLYVLAEATLSGVDINDPSFALIFTTAVIDSLKASYPEVSVTIIDIASQGERRAGDATVSYRVEVPAGSVATEEQLAEDVANTAVLSDNIRRVGMAVSGDASYSDASVSFSSAPDVVRSSDAKKSDSSNSNTSLIIGVAVGGTFLLILIIMVAVTACSSSKRQPPRQQLRGTSAKFALIRRFELTPHMLQPRVAPG
jgi:hypothetical protein